jgi:exosome complex component RRP42
LANSDILVGVKTEIDTPLPERPNEGKLEFFIDCSANATPQFEGRGGEELATEIANTLQKAYQSSNAFNLKSLCIMEQRQCWKLYIDVLILECGGNLFDAVSLAVKAALFNTRIPRVSAALMDGGSVDLILSDDPFDCDRLEIECVPLLVTLCKIGDQCVVDPSAEEEACSSASLVIGVSCKEAKGYVTTVRTSGSGSFLIDTLHQSVNLGVSAGECLNKELMKVLRLEESKSTDSGLVKKQVVGFLK